MKLRHPPALIEVRYAEYAQEYLRKLSLEHFMESTPQATQRKITLAAFDQIHLARPEVQAFNELLVQYPLPGQKRPGQVVPDNMVVIHEEKIKAEGSYDLPVQPVGLFMTLEYVSKRNRRKDYDDNFDKYEKHLLVPYYLMYVPDIQELTLYRLKGKKYVSVPPNKAGRHPVAQLELEVAILEGWVRYWFRGELLLLTDQLKAELEETRRSLQSEKRRADDEKRRADNAVRQAEEERQARLALEHEVEQLRAQLKKNGRR